MDGVRGDVDVAVANTLNFGLTNIPILLRPTINPRGLWHGADYGTDNKSSDCGFESGGFL